MPRSPSRSAMRRRSTSTGRGRSASAKRMRYSSPARGMGRASFLGSREMAVREYDVVGVPTRKMATITISRTSRTLDFTGKAVTIVTDNGGCQVTGSMIFTLDQLPNYAEFANLFDEYRIDKVKVIFVPNINVNTRADTMGDWDETQENRISQLGFCANYAGVAAPSSSEELPWLECEGYEQHAWSKPISVTITPKVLNEVYNTGAFSNYSAATKSQWIIMANTNAAHYGILWRVYDPYLNGLTQPSPNPQGTMYVTYTVSFRGPK